ncbi:PLD-like domain protein [Collimonas fungivorans]|uniref:PLD-like domain protein n=1 Tax=Collimonas fungivorans TaxID=158899 RepID=A0A127P6R6_9BURK|nr:phospholipase D-like domain-containing protein [Collimonas fungivorans]AMO93492.1 PLD-like domain protein [Collimonas fungivorans]
MSITVAIPLRFATVRLYVDKGRKWNAVEHLLLFSLVAEPKSAAETVTNTSLPWRLVVEVMSRLMRVGWVEIVNRKDDIAFKITNAGKSVVSNDTLPAVTRQISKRSSFVIDGITGTVFRARDLTLRSRTQLNKLTDHTAVLELPIEQSADKLELDEIISTLLDEDEHCRGVEPLASRFLDRFAIVTISDGEIEGLPPSAPQELHKRIRNAVFANASTETDITHQEEILSPDYSVRKIFKIDFNNRDLIVGGDEHKKFFVETINKAISWIVLHSTFINSLRFEEHLQILEAAARRGVRIDILWGKSTDPDGTNKIQDEVATCRNMLHDEVMLERIRLHRHTTDSHAKILFADDGNGKMIGCIGSCNWLSSSFRSFDVSIVFSSPQIVGDIAAKLSKLAIGKSGHWSNLAGDLAAQAANLTRHAEIHHSNETFTASIVLGSDHNEYMLQARDEAINSINVVSHRVSLNADTLVFVPAMAAINANGVKVNLYYELLSGISDAALVEELIKNNTTENLIFNKIIAPSLHAKFLTWDDDNIVITSQNWLSADPMDNSCSEIGIAISGKGIAIELLRRANGVLQQSNWSKS